MKEQHYVSFPEDETEAEDRFNRAIDRAWENLKLGKASLSKICSGNYLVFLNENELVEVFKNDERDSSWFGEWIVERNGKWYGDPEQSLAHIRQWIQREMERKS